MPFLDGRLRLYGDATYYMRQVQTTPFQADVELVGYYGRPLERRANAGAEWSRGAGDGRGERPVLRELPHLPAGRSDVAVSQATSLQGSARVPSQSYVDLHASWRGRLRVAGGLRT